MRPTAPRPAFRPIKSLLVLALCLLLPLITQAASLGEFFKARDTAAEHYSAGGQPVSSSLLLFTDGHWEKWETTCTDSHHSATGTFQRTDSQLILQENKKPDTILTLRQIDDISYLLTAKQLETLPAKPPDEFAYTDVYKRNQPTKP